MKIVLKQLLFILLLCVPVTTLANEAYRAQNDTFSITFPAKPGFMQGELPVTDNVTTKLVIGSAVAYNRAFTSGYAKLPKTANSVTHSAFLQNVQKQLVKNNGATLLSAEEVPWHGTTALFFKILFPNKHQGTLLVFKIDDIFYSLSIISPGQEEMPLENPFFSSFQLKEVNS